MIQPGKHTLTVVSQPRQWEGEYGTMHAYTVKVEGDEGAYDLSKKPSSPAPVVGQTIEVARIVPPKEGTTYLPKIKLAQVGGGGGRGPSPQDRRAMQRCHSQEMALRYAAIKQSQGKLPAEFTPADLFKIADHFDGDVDKVSKS